MHICLFEDDRSNLFAPLSFTRGVFDIRVGATTVAGLVKRTFPDAKLLLHTRPMLAGSMSTTYDSLVNHIPDGIGVLFLNSRWVPKRNEFARALKGITATNTGQLFVNGNDLIAAWVPAASGAAYDTIVSNGSVTAASFDSLSLESNSSDEPLLMGVWDLLARLPDQLAADFDWFSGGYNVFERPGAEIHPSAILLEGERIFIASGARIAPGVILNAEEGPIVIDKNAQVHERAVIRGPVYVGQNVHVNVQADIRSVAIGDHSKVGGEIHNVVIQSYSNKGHAGFLGNSFVGSWCNLGAGTNSSNLRNDYGIVDSYSYEERSFVSSGLQFAGLIMGDHSKCSIGTNFNTGTTIGVNCNLFGSQFHPRNVPSFCWGGEGKYSTYRIEKALSVAAAVMKRRGVELSDHDKDVLTALFTDSAAARTEITGG